MYGKQTECAIAVMSRLAKVYSSERTLLTYIARSRGLQLSSIKKIIGLLSRSDLVTVCEAREAAPEATMAEASHE